jgi:WD40 repeat protein
MKIFLTLVLFLLSSLVIAQEDADKLAYDVRWSPNGRFLGTVGEGGLYIHDMNEIEMDANTPPIHLFEGKTVTTFAFDPIRPHIAAAVGSGDIVEVVDFLKGENQFNAWARQYELDYASAIYDIQYSDNGRFLAVSNTRLITLFDAETGDKRQFYDLPVAGYPYGIWEWVTSLDFGRSATTLYAMDWDSQLTQLSAGVHYGKSQYVLDEPYKVERIEILPDGESVIFNSRNELYHFDMETEEKTLLFGSMDEPVSGFDLNDEGDQIAIGTNTGWVLYDLEQGEVISEYETTFREDVSQERVFALGFRPYFNQMITLQTDGQILLWDIETGEILDEFGDYTRAVSYKWG